MKRNLRSITKKKTALLLGLVLILAVAIVAVGSVLAFGINSQPFISSEAPISGGALTNDEISEGDTASNEELAASTDIGVGKVPAGYSGSGAAMTSAQFISQFNNSADSWLSASAKLTEDVTLTASNFAGSTTQINGDVVFDGQGHTITITGGNWTKGKNTTEYAGNGGNVYGSSLLGFYCKGTVKNLNIVVTGNLTLSNGSGGYAGGIVTGILSQSTGIMQNVSLTINSGVTVQITGTNSDTAAGGLAAIAADGAAINNCKVINNGTFRAASSVSGKHDCVGLAVGRADACSLNNILIEGNGNISAEDTAASSWGMYGALIGSARNGSCGVIPSATNISLGNIFMDWTGNFVTASGASGERRFGLITGAAGDTSAVNISTNYTIFSSKLDITSADHRTGAINFLTGTSAAEAPVYSCSGGSVSGTNPVTYSNNAKTVTMAKVNVPSLAEDVRFANSAITGTSGNFIAIYDGTENVTGITDPSNCSWNDDGYIVLNSVAGSITWTWLIPVQIKYEDGYLTDSGRTPDDYVLPSGGTAISNVTELGTWLALPTAATNAYKYGYLSRNFVIDSVTAWANVSNKVLAAGRTLDGNGYAITNTCTIAWNNDGSVTKLASASTSDNKILGFSYPRYQLMGGVVAVNNGTIKNLTFIQTGQIRINNANVNQAEGCLAVGGIAAVNRGRIENVTAKINALRFHCGGTGGADYFLGGIAAINEGGTSSTDVGVVSYCTANIVELNMNAKNGQGACGGLVGVTSGGKIEYSRTIGTSASFIQNVATNVASNGSNTAANTRLYSGGILGLGTNHVAGDSTSLSGRTLTRTVMQYVYSGFQGEYRNDAGYVCTGQIAGRFSTAEYNESANPRINGMMFYAPGAYRWNTAVSFSGTKAVSGMGTTNTTLGVFGGNGQINTTTYFSLYSGGRVITGLDSGYDVFFDYWTQSDYLFVQYDDAAKITALSGYIGDAPGNSQSTNANYYTADAALGIAYLTRLGMQSMFAANINSGTARHSFRVTSTFVNEQIVSDIYADSSAANTTLTVTTTNSGTVLASRNSPIVNSNPQTNVDTSYYLTSDITMTTDPGWICDTATNSTNNRGRYSGTLDGQGHTITLNISGGRGGNWGWGSNDAFASALIPWLTGTIKNVNFIVNSAAGCWTTRSGINNGYASAFGLIVGRNEGGTIENVKVTYSGDKQIYTDAGSEMYLSHLVAVNNGTIKNCTVTVKKDSMLRMSCKNNYESPGFYGVITAHNTASGIVKDCTVICEATCHFGAGAGNSNYNGLSNTMVTMFGFGGNFQGALKLVNPSNLKLTQYAGYGVGYGTTSGTAGYIGRNTDSAYTERFDYRLNLTQTFTDTSTLYYSGDCTASYTKPNQTTYTVVANGWRKYAQNGGQDGTLRGSETLPDAAPSSTYGLKLSSMLTSVGLTALGLDAANTYGATLKDIAKVYTADMGLLSSTHLPISATIIGGNIKVVNRLAFRGQSLVNHQILYGNYSIPVTLSNQLVLSNTAPTLVSYQHYFLAADKSEYKAEYGYTSQIAYNVGAYRVGLGYSNRLQDREYQDLALYRDLTAVGMTFSGSIVPSGGAIASGLTVVDGGYDLSVSTSPVPTVAADTATTAVYSDNSFISKVNITPKAIIIAEADTVYNPATAVRTATTTAIANDGTNNTNTVVVITDNNGDNVDILSAATAVQLTLSTLNANSDEVGDLSGTKANLSLTVLTYTIGGQVYYVIDGKTNYTIVPNGDSQSVTTANGQTTVHAVAKIRKYFLDISAATYNFTPQTIVNGAFADGTVQSSPAYGTADNPFVTSYNADSQAGRLTVSGVNGITFTWAGDVTSAGTHTATPSLSGIDTNNYAYNASSAALSLSIVPTPLIFETINFSGVRSAEYGATPSYTDAVGNGIRVASLTAGAGTVAATIQLNLSMTDAAFAAWVAPETGYAYGAGIAFGNGIATPNVGVYNSAYLTWGTANIKRVPPDPDPDPDPKFNSIASIGFNNIRSYATMYITPAPLSVDRVGATYIAGATANNTRYPIAYIYSDNAAHNALLQSLVGQSIISFGATDKNVDYQNNWTGDTFSNEYSANFETTPLKFYDSNGTEIYDGSKIVNTNYYCSTTPQGYIMQQPVTGAVTVYQNVYANYNDMAKTARSVSIARGGSGALATFYDANAQNGFTLDCNSGGGPISMDLTGVSTDFTNAGEKNFVIPQSQGNYYLNGTYTVNFNIQKLRVDVTTSIADGNVRKYYDTASGIEMWRLIAKHGVSQGLTASTKALSVNPGILSLFGNLGITADSSLVVATAGGHENGTDYSGVDYFNVGVYSYAIKVAMTGNNTNFELGEITHASVGTLTVLPTPIDVVLDTPAGDTSLKRTFNTTWQDYYEVKTAALNIVKGQPALIAQYKEIYGDGADATAYINDIVNGIPAINDVDFGVAYIYKQDASSGRTYAQHNGADVYGITTSKVKYAGIYSAFGYCQSANYVAYNSFYATQFDYTVDGTSITDHTYDSASQYATAVINAAWQSRLDNSDNVILNIDDFNHIFGSAVQNHAIADYVSAFTDYLEVAIASQVSSNAYSFTMEPAVISVYAKDQSVEYGTDLVTSLSGSYTTYGADSPYVIATSGIPAAAIPSINITLSLNQSASSVAAQLISVAASRYLPVKFDGNEITAYRNAIGLSGSNANNNYKITFVAGNLTIYKKELTFEWEYNTADTEAYNTATQAYQYSNRALSLAGYRINGLMFGDSPVIFSTLGTGTLPGTYYSYITGFDTNTSSTVWRNYYLGDGVKGVMQINARVIDTAISFTNDDNELVYDTSANAYIYDLNATGAAQNFNMFLTTQGQVSTALAASTKTLAVAPAGVDKDLFDSFKNTNPSITTYYKELNGSATATTVTSTYSNQDIGYRLQNRFTKPKNGGAGIYILSYFKGYSYSENGVDLAYFTPVDGSAMMIYKGACATLDANGQGYTNGTAQDSGSTHEYARIINLPDNTTVKTGYLADSPDRNWHYYSSGGTNATSEIGTYAEWGNRKGIVNLDTVYAAGYSAPAGEVAGNNDANYNVGTTVPSIWNARQDLMGSWGEVAMYQNTGYPGRYYENGFTGNNSGSPNNSSVWGGNQVADPARLSAYTAGYTDTSRCVYIGSSASELISIENSARGRVDANVQFFNVTVKDPVLAAKLAAGLLKLNVTGVAASKSWESGAWWFRTSYMDVLVQGIPDAYDVTTPTFKWDGMFDNGSTMTQTFAAANDITWANTSTYAYNNVSNASTGGGWNYLYGLGGFAYGSNPNNGTEYLNRANTSLVDCSNIRGFSSFRIYLISRKGGWSNGTGSNADGITAQWGNIKVFLTDNTPADATQNGVTVGGSNGEITFNMGGTSSSDFNSINKTSTGTAGTVSRYSSMTDYSMFKNTYVTYSDGTKGTLRTDAALLPTDRADATLKVSSFAYDAYGLLRRINLVTDRQRYSPYANENTLTGLNLHDNNGDRIIASGNYYWYDGATKTGTYLRLLGTAADNSWVYSGGGSGHYKVIGDTIEFWTSTWSNVWATGSLSDGVITTTSGNATIGTYRLDTANPYIDRTAPSIYITAVAGRPFTTTDAQQRLALDALSGGWIANGIKSVTISATDDKGASNGRSNMSTFEVYDNPRGAGAMLYSSTTPGNGTKTITLDVEAYKAYYVFATDVEGNVTVRMLYFETNDTSSELNLAIIGQPVEYADADKTTLDALDTADEVENWAAGQNEYYEDQWTSLNVLMRLLGYGEGNSLARFYYRYAGLGTVDESYNYGWVALGVDETSSGYIVLDPDSKWQFETTGIWQLEIKIESGSGKVKYLVYQSNGKYYYNSGNIDVAGNVDLTSYQVFNAPTLYGANVDGSAQATEIGYYTVKVDKRRYYLRFETYDGTVGGSNIASGIGAISPDTDYAEYVLSKDGVEKVVGASGYYEVAASTENNSGTWLDLDINTKIKNIASTYDVAYSISATGMYYVGGGNMLVNSFNGTEWVVTEVYDSGVGLNWHRSLSVNLPNPDINADDIYLVMRFEYKYYVPASVYYDESTTSSQYGEMPSNSIASATTLYGGTGSVTDLFTVTNTSHYAVDLSGKNLYYSPDSVEVYSAVVNGNSSTYSTSALMVSDRSETEVVAVSLTDVSASLNINMLTDAGKHHIVLGSATVGLTAAGVAAGLGAGSVVLGYGGISLFELTAATGGAYALNDGIYSYVGLGNGEFNREAASTARVVSNKLYIGANRYTIVTDQNGDTELYNTAGMLLGNSVWLRGAGLNATFTYDAANSTCTVNGTEYKVNHGNDLYLDSGLVGRVEDNNYILTVGADIGTYYMAPDYYTVTRKPIYVNDLPQNFGKLYDGNVFWEAAENRVAQSNTATFLSGAEYNAVAAKYKTSSTGAASYAFDAASNWSGQDVYQMQFSIPNFTVGGTVTLSNTTIAGTTTAGSGNVGNVLSVVSANEGTFTAYGHTYSVQGGVVYSDGIVRGAKNGTTYTVYPTVASIELGYYILIDGNNETRTANVGNTTKLKLFLSNSSNYEFGAVAADTDYEVNTDSPDFSGTNRNLRDRTGWSSLVLGSRYAKIYQRAIFVKGNNTQVTGTATFDGSVQAPSMLTNLVENENPSVAQLGGLTAGQWGTLVGETPTFFGTATAVGGINYYPILAYNYNINYADAGAVIYVASVESSAAAVNSASSSTNYYIPTGGTSGLAGSQVNLQITAAQNMVYVSRQIKETAEGVKSYVISITVNGLKKSVDGIAFLNAGNTFAADVFAAEVTNRITAGRSSDYQLGTPDNLATSAEITRLENLESELEVSDPVQSAAYGAQAQSLRDSIEASVSYKFQTAIGKIFRVAANGGAAYSQVIPTYTYSPFGNFKFNEAEGKLTFEYYGNKNLDANYVSDRYSFLIAGLSQAFDVQVADSIDTTTVSSNFYMSNSSLADGQMEITDYTTTLSSQTAYVISTVNQLKAWISANSSRVTQFVADGTPQVTLTLAQYNKAVLANNILSFDWGENGSSYVLAAGRTLDGNGYTIELSGNVYSAAGVSLEGQDLTTPALNACTNWTAYGIFMPVCRGTLKNLAFNYIGKRKYSLTSSTGRSMAIGIVLGALYGNGSIENTSLTINGQLAVDVYSSTSTKRLMAVGSMTGIVIGTSGSNLTSINNSTVTLHYVANKYAPISAYEVEISIKEAGTNLETMYGSFAGATLNTTFTNNTISTFRGLGGELPTIKFIKDAAVTANVNWAFIGGYVGESRMENSNFNGIINKFACNIESSGFGTTLTNAIFGIYNGNNADNVYSYYADNYDASAAAEKIKVGVWTVDNVERTVHSLASTPGRVSNLAAADLIAGADLSIYNGDAGLVDYYFGSNMYDYQRLDESGGTYTEQHYTSTKFINGAAVVYSPFDNIGWKAVGDGTPIYSTYQRKKIQAVGSFTSATAFNISGVDYTITGTNIMSGATDKGDYDADNMLLIFKNGDTVEATYYIGEPRDDLRTVANSINIEVLAPAGHFVWDYHLTNYANNLNIAGAISRVVWSLGIGQKFSDTTYYKQAPTEGDYTVPGAGEWERQWNTPVLGSYSINATNAASTIFEYLYNGEAQTGRMSITISTEYIDATGQLVKENKIIEVSSDEALTDAGTYVVGDFSGVGSSDIETDGVDRANRTATLKNVDGTQVYVVIYPYAVASESNNSVNVNQGAVGGAGVADVEKTFDNTTLAPQQKIANAALTHTGDYDGVTVNLDYADAMAGPGKAVDVRRNVTKRAWTVSAEAIVDGGAIPEFVNFLVAEGKDADGNSIFEKIMYVNARAKVDGVGYLSTLDEIPLYDINDQETSKSNIRMFYAAYMRIYGGAQPSVDAIAQHVLSLYAGYHKTNGLNGKMYVVPVLGGARGGNYALVDSIATSYEGTAWIVDGLNVIEDSRNVDNATLVADGTTISRDFYLDKSGNYIPYEHALAAINGTPYLSASDLAPVDPVQLAAYNTARALINYGCDAWITATSTINQMNYYNTTGVINPRAIEVEYKNLIRTAAINNTETDKTQAVYKPYGEVINYTAMPLSLSALFNDADFSVNVTVTPTGDYYRTEGTAGILYGTDDYTSNFTFIEAYGTGTVHANQSSHTATPYVLYANGLDVTRVEKQVEVAGEQKNVIFYYYNINDATQLKMLETGASNIDVLKNMSFVLTADIDMAGARLAPLAWSNDSTVDGLVFTGLYNNIANVISNFNLYSLDSDNRGGIFAVNNGTIENIGFADAVVFSADTEGVLIDVNNGTVNNVFFEGKANGMPSDEIAFIGSGSGTVKNSFYMTGTEFRIYNDAGTLGTTLTNVGYTATFAGTATTIAKGDGTYYTYHELVKKYVLKDAQYGANAGTSGDPILVTNYLQLLTAKNVKWANFRLATGVIRFDSTCRVATSAAAEALVSNVDMNGGIVVIGKVVGSNYYIINAAKTASEYGANGVRVP